MEEQFWQKKDEPFAIRSSVQNSYIYDGYPEIKEFSENSIKSESKQKMSSVHSDDKEFEEEKKGDSINRLPMMNAETNKTIHLKGQTSSGIESDLIRLSKSKIGIEHRSESESEHQSESYAESEKEPQNYSDTSQTTEFEYTEETMPWKWFQEEGNKVKVVKAEGYMPKELELRDFR